MKHLVLITTIAAMTLSACSGENGNRTTGTLLGAGVGALAGSALGGTVATIVGAVAGAYVGGEIAKSMDDRDRRAMEKTTQQALNTSPAGKTSRWSNPDSGAKGSVTPQQAFKDNNGNTCREYQETVNAKGQSQTGYRTACQQSDGSWRIVNG